MADKGDGAHGQWGTWAIRHMGDGVYGHNNAYECIHIIVSNLVSYCKMEMSLCHCSVMKKIMKTSNF